MVGALAEPDERDVGTFSRSYRPDVLDIDLASDHLMPEAATIGATSARRSLRSFAIRTRRCSVSR